MNFLKSVIAGICACSLLCLCACKPALSEFTANSSDITQSDNETASSFFSTADKTESENPSSNSQSAQEDIKKPQNVSSVTSSKNQTSNTASQKPTSSASNFTSSKSSDVSQQTKPQEQPNKSLTAVSTDNYYGWKWLEQNGTEAEKKVYKLLVSELGNYKSTVKFNFTLSKKEFDNAYGLYKEDYPEHFWRGTEYTLSSVNDKITKASFSNTLFNSNAEKISAVQKKVEKAAEEILSKLDGSMSDYEKEIAIHDYIVNNTVYADGENAHSIVGVFIDGKAVCQGYSLAFQYLMRLAGVQCITVTGRFRNQDHMWNMVKLDGEFYHIDVTADDPITSSGENIIIFNYFNLTDKQIGIDHTVNNKEFTPPAATATKYEFFTTTGQVYSGFSVESFAHSIAYAYQHGYKYAYMRYENVDLSKTTQFIKDNYHDIIDRANEILGSKKIKTDTKINVMYGEERGIVDFKINY